MNKKDLRKNIIKKRSLLAKDTITEYSKIITDTLRDLDSYKNAKRIMTFVSMPGEVETHPLIEQAISEGKSILVPITVDETRELLLSDLYDLSELEVADFNIEIPKAEFIRLKEPDTIDLVLVPGLAFAKDGYRVGYGGGYYDRFLAKLDESIPLIGLGFDLQIVDQVPTDHFDMPIDLIITEKRVINCKGK